MRLLDDPQPESHPEANVNGMMFILQIAPPHEATAHIKKHPHESDNGFVQRTLDAVGKQAFMATLFDTTGLPPGEDIANAVKVTVESPYYDPQKSGDKEEAMMRLLAATYKIMSGRIVGTHMV